MSVKINGKEFKECEASNNPCTHEIPRGNEAATVMGKKFGEMIRLLHVQNEKKYEDDPFMEIHCLMAMYTAACTSDPNTKCSSAGLKAFIKHILIDHEKDYEDFKTKQ